jgi:hypothetical protein
MFRRPPRHAQLGGQCLEASTDSNAVGAFFLQAGLLKR